MEINQFKEMNNNRPLFRINVKMRSIIYKI